MARRFNKLLLCLKDLLQKQKYIWPENKANFAVHMDLTKRCYLLLKDAYSNSNGCTSVVFTCADINCSLYLRLKNGD